MISKSTEKVLDPWLTFEVGVFYVDNYGDMVVFRMQYVLQCIECSIVRYLLNNADH